MKEKKYVFETWNHALPCVRSEGRRKRYVKGLLLLAMLSSLLMAAGCGGDKSVSGQSAESKGVDVDLTQLNSTMVYSEVYNMKVTPEDYEGKIVKVKGKFSVFQNEENGKAYFACVISDVADCCSQGMEFELEGDYKFPDDYPKAQEEITVVGEFSTYQEDGNQYCHLKNAKFL